MLTTDDEDVEEVEDVTVAGVLEETVEELADETVDREELFELILLLLPPDKRCCAEVCED